MERAYLVSSRALGALLFLVGLAMIVATLLRGGGPSALGIVLGAVLAALGAARTWLAFGARTRGRHE